MNYKTTGNPTGFIALDVLTSGWKLGELVIIGSHLMNDMRVFAFSMLKKTSKQYSSSYFSISLSKKQLDAEIISIKTGVSSRDIINGKVSTNKYPLHFYTEHISTLTPTIFRKTLQNIIIKKNIKLVVIDYLQLMTITNYKGNRNKEIHLILKELKQIALDLKISIVVLSLLLYKGEGKRSPYLSELTNIGVNSEYTDIILMMYREESWGTRNWYFRENEIQDVKFIVAKYYKNKGVDGSITLRRDRYRYHD